MDSVEILNDQNGSDVRDALVYAARHDPNAGVRLKALEGLRRFVDDPATRESLAFVLQHDDNSDVRSQAIDVLAPMAGKVELSPELAGTLQEIVRSEQGDDYVRMRCMQLLVRSECVARSILVRRRSRTVVCENSFQIAGDYACFYFVIAF